MQTVLIVVHLMIVMSLIAVVLLQRSEGGALGIGGGGGGFLSSRGQANVLTRATAILAAGFFVTSLALTILAGWGRATPSVFDSTAPATAPVTAPGQPSPPLGTGQGGILPMLRPNAPAPAPAGPSEPAPPLFAPAAPSGPAPAP